MRGDDRSRARCAATSRRRSGCRRTTRCGRSAAWWTRRWRSCPRTFDALYSKTGRPSIPPEQLLRALLLQVLYTIRSERLLMEQLDYNLLFRWFVGLTMDDPVWDPTTFSKNRDRLLDGRDGAGVLRAGPGAGPEPGPAVGRALHGGRDADRGLGRAEELPTARTQTRRPAPTTSRQSDGGLPRREAQQRDARIHDGSGGAAVPEGRRDRRPSCASWATC